MIGFGAAALIPRNCPVTLVAKARSHRPGSVASMVAAGFCTPALFTRIVSRPKACSAAATAPAQSSSRVTSRPTATARSSSSAASAAVDEAVTTMSARYRIV